MPARITENGEQIVFGLQSREVVKPQCVDSVAIILDEACELAIQQRKPLQLDLRLAENLSAAAIGRFVQTGRKTLEAKLGVQFVIPAHLEGMFRVLHLHNLFDVRVGDQQNEALASDSQATEA